MKENKINLLLVDDHHLILEGCKNVLSSTQSETQSYQIDIADNCDSAWEKINMFNFHIVCLDINFAEKQSDIFFSGEDLGIKIRKELPEIKLIIMTTLVNPFRIYNVIANINPEGFLLKTETNSIELTRCFEKVLTSPPYFSSKVSKTLQGIATDKVYIDKIDRIMLYQLSLGTKTKDLPKFVYLSLRAIEDRKKKLKIKLGVNGKGNKELLSRAKEFGYI